MMYIRKLSLINFKNIEQADLEFTAGINCFTGDNGAGKTNAIDAVHYLSMCKSALSMTDGQSVRHGAEFFVLDGDYMSDSGIHEAVTCSFKRSAGKSVRRNSKEYERLSDHIGVIPVVIVAPGDIFLISDAAEERRRWLDSFISQTDREYLNALLRYNRIISERNRLLKNPDSASNRELLDILDRQLAMNGRNIHSRRADIIAGLQPIVTEYYKAISGDREQVELSYRSELNGRPFEELLSEARQKDILCQFTTSGIHRDDMVMKIGGHLLRKYGSQGQQKSFLIALKLAQHTLLAGQTGERPILLLDDLFDKLDTSRLQALLTLVGGGNFGQIIISDCNRSRLLSILDGCSMDYTLFGVADGVINRELKVENEELGN